MAARPDIVGHALLIAGVGSALLTMIVGVARITQLRRRFRRDYQTSH